MSSEVRAASALETELHVKAQVSLCPVHILAVVLPLVYSTQGVVAGVLHHVPPIVHPMLHPTSSSVPHIKQSTGVAAPVCSKGFGVP